MLAAREDLARFPDDFVFQMTLEEGKVVILSRSQIATLKRGQNVKYRPYVFTEHGAFTSGPRDAARSLISLRRKGRRRHLTNVNAHACAKGES
jgi:ORF6N domain